jgi:hypothetical protein
MASYKYISRLFQRTTVVTVQTRFIDLFCYILFILGIVRNLVGLFIFSWLHRTWRISSVYACLATCSSITNLLCIIRYASVLHSTSRQILRQLVGHTWLACKIYKFFFSFRAISSWIILFWMFERLTCVSRRLRTFFNRWHSFKLNLFPPIIIIILILSCVFDLQFLWYQPRIILEYVNIQYPFVSHLILCNGPYHDIVNSLPTHLWNSKNIFMKFILVGIILQYVVFCLNWFQLKRLFYLTVT